MADLVIEVGRRESFYGKSDALRILHPHVAIERVDLRLRLVGDDDQAEVAATACQRTLRRERNLHAASGWYVDVVADLRTGGPRIIGFVEVDRRGEQVRARVEQRHLAGETVGLRAHRKHDCGAHSGGGLGGSNGGESQQNRDC
jgi:hypothetical protein